MSAINRTSPPRVTVTLAASFGITLILVLISLSAASLPVIAATKTLKNDTVADFNPGTFYHTGLTADTNPNNTGDGNGEVRLLNVGINPATWRNDGNVVGLPSTGLWGHAAVYYNGRIYVSGGNDGSNGATNGVYYTTINSDHTLANWTSGSALPAKRYSHAMTQLNGYLYVIGGIDDQFNVTKTVYKAQVNATTGVPGSWTATNDLPVSQTDVGVYDTAAVAVSGRVYVLGGHNSSGGSIDKVFIGTPDGNGNLSWTTSSTTLPIPVGEHTATVSNNHIYLVGGVNNNPNPPVYSPDVYIGTPDTSGDITSWTQDPVNMPNNLVHASGATFADQVYAAGGAINTGGTPLNSILSNLLSNTNGALASNWVTNNVLSSARIQTAAVMTTDGWLYVIEGGSGSNGLTPLKTIDYGPTSSTGTCNVADNCSYASSGTYTSPLFDFGSSRPVLQLRWNTSSVQNVTAVKMQYRYGDTIDAIQNASWQPGTPLNSTTGTKQTSSTNFSSTSARYFQYRVTLSTSDSSTTPIVNWVELDYDAPATPTPTNTPTLSATPTKTGTLSPTPTFTNTPTPTSIGSVTPTSTPCSTKPVKTSLLSPNKKANLFVRAVPLAWQAATCGQKYKVIVKYDNKYGARAFKKGNITDLSVTTKRLDKGRTYVWKVRACNPLGCGKWSDWWSFKVAKNAK
jgi:N-acetylneuraminic acid mutarotase